MNGTRSNQDPRIVWERYVASWKAKSSEEKKALFETCLSPECVYTDPLAQTKGWAELLVYMAGFHRQVGADLEMYGKEYHPSSPESVIYYAIPLTAP